MPTGVTLTEVLDLCDATVGPGVLLGGYHGKWITPEAAERAEVSRAGFDGGRRHLRRRHHASARVGHLPARRDRQGGCVTWPASPPGSAGRARWACPTWPQAFGALADGNGRIEAVQRAADAIRGRGACSHPDGTSRFVLSAIDVFAEDVMTHAAYGTCGVPVRNVLPMPAEPSSRASEAQLILDWSRCEGHGLCSLVVPELIRLDQHGYPVVSTASVPGRLEGDARRAIEMCPALALRLTPAPTESRR